MTTHTEPVNTDSCYKISVITRTHGTRGELSINFTDDVWDRADADYIFLMVAGILVPFFLEEWRFRSCSSPSSAEVSSFSGSVSSFSFF